MLPLTRLAPLLAASLVACSDPPTVEGTVTDIWGKPVAEAKVTISGEPSHGSTDAAGHFLMELSSLGAKSISAGKEKYINAEVKLTVDDDDETPAEKAAIQLYPEPEKHGFYGVGRQKYVELPAQPIGTVGTEIRAYTGLKSVGDSLIPKDAPARFLYSSELRKEEIARLDLKLHRLEFVDSPLVPGALGEQPVKVALWIAKDTVAFDLKGMPSPDDYLITTREPLAPGVYAFNIGGLLSSSDVHALDSLPREMREAWAFEVK
jgi:hypothetical protein